jgi:hypothetical protein
MRYLKSKGFLASGGRVGYQDGTPNPDMVMPQPKPREAVQDRKLDTLMDAAPALENPNEAKSMGEKRYVQCFKKKITKRNIRRCSKINCIQSRSFRRLCKYIRSIRRRIVQSKI